LHKDENPILGKHEPTYQERRSKKEDYARQLLPDGLSPKKAGGANRREFTPPVPEDLFSSLSASQSPRTELRSQQMDYARQLDSQKQSRADALNDRSIYVGEEYQAYPQGPPPSIIRGTKQKQQQEYAQQIREHAELQTEPSRKESYAALLETNGDGLSITKGRGPTTVHGHRTYKEVDSSRVLNRDNDGDSGSPRSGRIYKGETNSARVFGQGYGEANSPRSRRVYQDEEHSGRVLGKGADPKSPRSRKGFPEPSSSGRVLGIAAEDDGADGKSRPQSLRVYKAENSYGRVFGDADYATEGTSPRSRKAFKGKNTNRALGLVEDSDAKSPRSHRVFQEKNTNRALGLVEDVDAVSPRGPRMFKEENSHNRVFGPVDHNKLPQSPPRGHRVYKEKDTSRALGLVEDSDAVSPRGHRVYTGPSSSRVFNLDSDQDGYERRPNQQPVTSSESYRNELINSPRRALVTAPAYSGSLGASFGDDSLTGLIQRQSLASRGEDNATGLLLGGMAEAADRLARKKELQQKYAADIASSAAAPPIESSRGSIVYRAPQTSLDYKIRGNSSGGGASSLMIR